MWEPSLREILDGYQRLMAMVMVSLSTWWYQPSRRKRASPECSITLWKLAMAERNLGWREKLGLAKSTPLWLDALPEMGSG